MTRDGLSNLKFELLDKRPILIDGKILPNSFHYVVDIGRPETADPVSSSAGCLDPGQPRIFPFVPGPLERDPEKWIPVFIKDHAPPIS